MELDGELMNAEMKRRAFSSGRPRRRAREQGDKFRLDAGSHLVDFRDGGKGYCGCGRSAALAEDGLLRVAAGAGFA
jgi:hypothetical protein